jgi:hypothetical protein
LKKLIVTGDSHAIALREGLRGLEKDTSFEVEARRLGTGRHMLQPFFRNTGSEIRFIVDDYTKSHDLFAVGNIKKNPDLVYGFSMGFHSAKLFSSNIWRSFAPWNLADSVNLAPVSIAAINAMIEAIWGEVLSFYENCIALGVEFFGIACPPPRRDHPCIEKGNDARVVAAVAQIAHDYMEKWLADRGRRCVRVPETTIDQGGFLREQFIRIAPNDTHHGNADYGELMMRDVIGEFANQYL